MPSVTSTSTKARPVLSVAQARLLLMNSAGLLSDPARRATPAAVHKQIERMGYVQVDTINIISRAHHHILRTRFDDYQPQCLTRLLEKDRKLFEHWTHDASVIPARWLGQWKGRFRRHRRRGHRINSWWEERMGKDGPKLIDHVLRRITEEGPLMSKDFEHPKKNGPWWGWKPQKAALEYLWRIGRVAIAARVNFHKVYDLIERIFPHLPDLPEPADEDYVDHSCREAMVRLVVATPSELAEFFGAINLAEARNWCNKAFSEGELVQAMVESADGTPAKPAWALPDWRRRAGRCSAPPDRLRLLSPFDPVLRDRKRALRLFGFDYRFEAFVPAAKRKFGYYVLPILRRDQLIGRLDAKLHRDRGELEVLGLWWEDRVRQTSTLRGALEESLNRFARQIGGDRVAMP